MSDFSAHENYFFEKLQGRFVLFGNPEHAGSKNTHWMQLNILNGTAIAGGRSDKSTSMERDLAMMIDKIDAGEFVVYQKREALDAAIAKNQEKKAPVVDDGDPLAIDRFEQRDDDAQHIKQERAYFHNEPTLTIEENVTSDHVEDLDDGHSREAVRGDDIARDLFEQFDAAPIMQEEITQQDAAEGAHVQAVLENSKEVIIDKPSDTIEEASTPLDVFEKFSDVAGSPDEQLVAQPGKAQDQEQVQEQVHKQVHKQEQEQVYKQEQEQVYKQEQEQEKADGEAVAVTETLRQKKQEQEHEEEEMHKKVERLRAEEQERVQKEQKEQKEAQKEEQAKEEQAKADAHKEIVQEKEGEVPVDLFEQFGDQRGEHAPEKNTIQEELAGDSAPSQTKKKRHAVPSQPLKRTFETPVPQTHKIKVPRTETEAVPHPHHVRAADVPRTDQNAPQLPLLEAVAQFWHETAHIHVTDAELFAADIRTFGNDYFAHFADEHKRVMYAWQAVRSDVPESFQMSTLFTQFNKKYGEEALVAYLGSLPDQV